MIASLKVFFCLLLLTYSLTAESKYRKSYISFEVKSDTIFLSQSENNKIYPASVTKIMTAHIILRDFKDLSQTTTITQNAWGHRFSNSSRMFLEPKMEVSLRDLVAGLLIQSGNDAATALAEHHSGSVERFVKEMNLTAKELGMYNTNFRNPHGRHDRRHFTTAYDMMLLVKEIFKATPDITHFTKMEVFEFNDIKQWNRNRTLKSPHSIGLKTGFTPQSGFNLAACYDINNGIFCTIQFGANSIDERHQKSISAYHSIFKTKEVYSLDLPITEFELNGITYVTERMDDFFILEDKGLKKKAMLKLSSHTNGTEEGAAIINFSIGEKKFDKEVKLVRYNQTN